MKILVIIDTKKNKYHEELYPDLEAALVSYFEDKGDNSLELFDMGYPMKAYEQYAFIENVGADLIITFDFAGFELKNTGDIISFNGLACRMAHLLFQNLDRYSLFLEERQNFSMYTYVPEGNDVLALRNRYTNITNIYTGPSVVYRNISDSDHASNVDLFYKWIESMLVELRFLAEI